MADVTGDGMGEPASHWYSISPSDSAYLDPIPRGLYVGVTGSLTVEDVDGTQVTFAAAPVGYHPLRPRKVLVTGTTASSLVALY